MKQFSKRILTAAAGLMAMGLLVQAQTPAPAPAAAPAPAPPTWSVGPIDFSGLIDGYFTGNFNKPLSRTTQLYNFNTQANQFGLSLAKLTMSHDADPVGFRVDLGYGNTMDIVNAGESTASKLIEQAFVSWKPKSGRGFDLDFGKFVTSAGAEVIESKDNWNYSHSLLFAWAIPYYHMGLRATLPSMGKLTLGAQVVNGWNNTVDNNTGKTIGITAVVAGKKATWSNVYYTGPENSNTNTGWRNLYDTNLLLTPSDKANFYINYDYGQNAFGGKTTTAKWTGIAGAAKFQLNGVFALTPRYEWFDDEQGFATGTTQKLQEFTITAEVKSAAGLFWRFEYRHDHSDHAFFEDNKLPVGATANVGGFTKKNMDTLTAAVVAYFGPKR